MHSLTHSFAHQRRIGASFGQTLRIPLSHHRRLRCEKTPLTVAAAAPSMVAIASSAVVNPVQSLVGGLTIGLAVAAKLATTGRVTGISGIYSGLLRGSLDTWRISFIGGLLAGGALLAKLLPSAFATAFPATFTTTRAVVAGLLVGAGSSMGSGCTSGHGVCGLARLSARSLAAVLTFMATGAVTATVFDTAAAVGAAVPTWPSVFSLAAVADPQALQLASVGGIAVVAIAIILGAVRTLMPTAIRADVAEFASGTIFALGLGVGGMLQPSKVAAFLSPAGALFDPSLMAVMGGALLITTPAFQFFTRMNKVGERSMHAKPLVVCHSTCTVTVAIMRVQPVAAICYQRRHVAVAGQCHLWRWLGTCRFVMQMPTACCIPFCVHIVPYRVDDIILLFECVPACIFHISLTHRDVPRPSTGQLGAPNTSGRGVCGCHVGRHAAAPGAVAHGQQQC